MLILVTKGESENGALACSALENQKVDYTRLVSKVAKFHRKVPEKIEQHDALWGDSPQV